MIGVNTHFRGSLWSVVQIYDGDTIRLQGTGKEGVIVRLWGIDAPEQGQHWFRESRACLATLLKADEIVIRSEGIEKWGRWLGRIEAKEKGDISLRMIEAGGAWWYRQFAPWEKEYGEAQQKARAAGIGLWQEESPVPPWKWRHSVLCAPWGYGARYRAEESSIEKKAPLRFVGKRNR